MFSSPSYHDEGYTLEKISSVINKTTWKRSKEKVICYTLSTVREEVLLSEI